MYAYIYILKLFKLFCTFSEESVEVPVSTSPAKKVLVLGSGHVAGPLVAYLARFPAELLVVSAEQKELNALKRLPGQRFS